MQTIEGHLTAPSGRFVIVAARFNEIIVARLILGATDALRRLGVAEDQVQLVRAPGAHEIPLVCKWVIESLNPSAIIALGCVVRGDTYHFEVVAGQSASGIAALSIATGVPIINGILTTNSLDQAFARAGGHGGDKGADAAFAALEMVNLRAGIRA